VSPQKRFAKRAGDYIIKDADERVGDVGMFTFGVPMISCLMRQTADRFDVHDMPST